jgi:hypothetical protein
MVWTNKSCQTEEREWITTYKESLSPEQRSELHERALEEIRKTKGIKEEFITEILINAKPVFNTCKNSIKKPCFWITSSLCLCERLILTIL